MNRVNREIQENSDTGTGKRKCLQIVFANSENNWECGRKFRNGALNDQDVG